MAALRRLTQVYDVREIYCDWRQFGFGWQLLKDSGLPLADGPIQSTVALVEATATFVGLVNSGKVIHDGDEELRRQVLGAQVKDRTTGAYFQPADNNAFIGLIIAVHQALEHINDRAPRIHAYQGA
jgi:phage terminase large subunit-like protein